MNMWRRSLLLVLSLSLLLGIIFGALPVYAVSKDEIFKEYRRQHGLDWLCNEAKFMNSPLNEAANTLGAYFSYGDNKDTRLDLNGLLGQEGSWDDGEFVITFMHGLGYRWQGNIFTRPDAATVCSNAAHKYNRGKNADLTSAQMKWAEASIELDKECLIYRIGKPAEIQTIHGDKLDAARTGRNTGGRRYALINEITDSGTVEEVLYGFDSRARIEVGNDTDQKCVDIAKRVSDNAKSAVKNAKKEAAEARGNVAGRYIANKLCEPLKTTDPNDYSSCIDDITKRASGCFEIHGENVSSIKSCLNTRLAENRDKITDDLVREALSLAIKEVPDDTINGGTADNSEDKEEITCNITGIGWIVCPTMNFIATINDAMFALVSQLLTTHPDIFTMKDDNPTYVAWGFFRNIANVAFVIIFLIVIFSQVASLGISNYGIKQILPRLIIGAILINASFIISMLAADISSILGSSLKSLLEQAAVGGSVDSASWGHILGEIVLGAPLAVGAGAVGAAALWAIGIPGAIAFLVSILMTLIILIGRQAGIILLAVLSPLAFAALILPNTERWFRRWMSMYGGLLMVFPIISLLFGAGSFAAAILNNNNDHVMQIAALIVSALPLAATPTLLKKSMDSLGSIGQMAGSLSGKFSGKAREAASNSSLVKHRENLAAQRKAQIQSGTYKESFGKFDPRRLRNLHSRINAARNQNKRFNKITGNYGERMSVLGASVAAAQDKEAMEAANASVSSMNLDGAGLMNLIERGKDKNGNQVTDHQRRAAMQQLAPIMTGKEARKLASLSVNFNDDMRKEATAAVRTAAPKAPWLGGKSLAEIQAGTFDESSAMNRYMEEKMSAEDFNTMDAASIDTLNAQARTEAAQGNTDPQSKLQSAKAAHSRSAELTSKISTGNRDALRRI